jgi:hypothetical protein
MKPASFSSTAWCGAVLLVLLGGGLSLPACRSVERPRLYCMYGGAQKPVGSSFSATDGCNTCTCGADTLVACTEKACRDGGATPPRADAAPAGQTDGAPVSGPEAGPAADSGARPSDAAPTGTCQYGGATHPAGQSFPATDGCNTCTCLNNGAVGCTRRACLPDAAPAVCALGDSYEYGDIGGLRIFVERSHLGPGNSYRHTRTPLVGTGPLLSCAPPLPACNAAGSITAADLERDLADPDVRAALAETVPPVYGRDNRPVDGVVFELKRADGRGFLAGAACNGQPGCRNVPVGIARLTALLRELDQQQLAAPACQGIRLP